MGTSVEFEKVWETLGISETVVDQAPGKTIVPESLNDRVSQSRYVPLPRFIAEDGEKAPAQLELGEVIGQGGMGLIQLALQVPLGRCVAVKSIRPDKLSESSTNELLREAWLTGSLEHPNIVPVYALGQGETGNPMLVMKRIEGTSWQTYLEDPEKLKAEHRIDDLLEWHLQVLLKVCQAIKFAHSKGIIHRDLKPENTMIGRFGEVYVLDWGIAVSLLPVDRGRLPLASEIKSVAGTPAYMAPEMAEAKGALISEATDVYLLGATLHEVVTGTPRHSGVSIYQVLMQAFRSQPVDYERNVPSGLATICNKATHRNPKERYPTVEAFEDALQWYRRHRVSLRLSSEANARLRDLLESIELADETSASELYRDFGACRFGFLEAIRESADNREAEKGLQLAFETMISYEIRHRDARAAKRLLVELPTPRPDLAARIETLDEELRAQQAEVAQLRLDVDLTVGARTRMFLTAVIGLVFTTMPIILGVAGQYGYVMNYFDYMLTGLLFLALVVGGAVWARESMTKTETNRRVFRMVLAVALASIMLRAIGWIRNVELTIMLNMELLLYTLGMGVSAATIDRRLLLATPPFLLGSVLAAFRPAWTMYIFGCTMGLTLFGISYIWRPDAIWPRGERGGRRERG